MKIGILGGTFDPIHIGHLMIGENAYLEMGLDKVLVIPTGNPPHKDSNLISDVNLRVEMIKMSIKDNSHFEFSDIEMNRQGKVYTADTLELLKKKYDGADLYFIMGEDSLDYFDKWHEPERIVKNATILVSCRSDNGELIYKIQKMNSKYGEKFKLIKTPFLDISSTDIRNRCKQSKSIRYMVVDKVADFIEKEEVYR